MTRSVGLRPAVDKLDGPLLRTAFVLVPGLVLLPAALAALVYGCTAGAGVPLAGGTVLMAAYVAYALAGRLADRMAPRPLILSGILVTLAGTYAFTLLGSSPAAPVLPLSLVVRGAGLGLVMAPGMAAIYGSVTKDQVLDGGLAPAAAYGATFWWTMGLSAATLLPAFLYPGRERPPA
ncbi:hypothetical protein MTP10_29470 [Nonomuraea sp. 3-1Str]|uniref:hypothetical protein n=1 Tax=Nonomuraea sp. 3-1Str TaxID=2929801 RepID=UPI00285F0326|nr:hypothetical protein [Nonomuraea sp. 3-1Str]MDR8412848.1 hypothetical protein [Nonomuraea sp. 3-1Str]